MSKDSKRSNRTDMKKQNKNEKPKVNERNKRNYSMRGKQGKKDSGVRRVNFDNERVSKFEKEFETAMCNGGNDITWYAKNPEFLKAASNLPFAKVTGLSQAGQLSIPGIMCFQYEALIGANDDVANLAFESMYSYIVHANSRNYAYNAPDLGMLILAGIDVFTAITEGIRVFGVAKWYEQRNTYVPDDLIAALGFDAADIRKNLSTMWFDLNDVINMARQIWLPAVLPIVNRRNFLSSTLFSDAPGPEAQMYVFRQRQFYHYDETSVTTGGCLKRYTQPRVHLTWSDHIAMIRDMISSLLNSEDRGIIFGDILNAYGADRIIAMQPIASDYTVVPQYNPEVQSQIENLCICSINPTAIAQEQDHNKIFTSWQELATTGIEMAVPPLKPILNFHTPDQPSNEMITIATRLSAAGAIADKNRYVLPTGTKVTPKKAAVVRPYTCGTELIYQADLIVKTLTTTSTAGVATINSGPFVLSLLSSGVPTLLAGISNVLNLSYLHITDTAPTLSANDYYLQLLTIMSAFDWHPFLYYDQDTYAIEFSTKTPEEPLGVVTSGMAFGDVDNMIELSANELDKLNTVCLYSLFNVPSM